MKQQQIPQCACGRGQVAWQRAHQYGQDLMTILGVCHACHTELLADFWAQFSPRQHKREQRVLVLADEHCSEETRQRALARLA